MRGTELLDKMDLIDPDYVEAADSVHKKKKSGWQKWGAAAACIAVAFGMTFFALRFKENGTVPVPNSTRTVSFGGITREYKDMKVTVEELAIVWQWKYKTMAEKYTSLVYNGAEYDSSGIIVEMENIGDEIGMLDAVGYDLYEEKEYRISTQVCSIRGISPEKMVAVQLGDDFYSFKNREYQPPKTFGEVLDDYSLSEHLALEYFDVCEGFSENGYYQVEDDSYIWEILSNCRGAVFVEDDSWSRSEREYLSFTATSDALGVYKRVFYVTADGYIWTNIFDWAYIFKIGEDAAKKIISYAVDNSVATEQEPYNYSLAGTLVEITDEYILVDDTIRCANPEDGMLFKIMLNDVRIRRCMEWYKFQVGTTVAVAFTGDIDVDAGNVVKGAYSLKWCMIADGEALLPE